MNSHKNLTTLDDMMGIDLGQSMNPFNDFGLYIDGSWSNLLDDDPTPYDHTSGSNLNAFVAGSSTSSEFLSPTASIMPLNYSVLPRPEAPHTFRNPTLYPHQSTNCPSPYLIRNVHAFGPNRSVETEQGHFMHVGVIRVCPPI